MNILQPEIDKFNLENPTLEAGNRIINRIHNYSLKCLKENIKQKLFMLTDNEWNLLRRNPILFSGNVPDKPDGLTIFGVDVMLWSEKE